MHDTELYVPTAHNQLQCISSINLRICIIQLCMYVYYIICVHVPIFECHLSCVFSSAYSVGVLLTASLWQH